MKTKNRLFICAGILVLFSQLLFAQPPIDGGAPQIMEKVEPNTVSAGTENISITLTLLDLGTPPIPPLEIQVSSLKIGNLEGRNISRNDREISALFDFGENESLGAKDVYLAFPGPDGQTIEFFQTGLFQITDESGETHEEPGTPVDPVATAPNASNFVIIDTNQKSCYNNSASISAPDKGDDFYGQDAQFQNISPAYQDNGDGTITDLNTGLMWQKDLPADKYVWSECVTYAENSTLAGYDDWRLPTIKELYSLVLFSGVTSTSESNSVPYLDTDYFDFRFGGEVNPEERFIDSQYATSTIYKGTTMGGNETMFGYNFVDGRIKGYPTHKEFDIKMVRGKSSYGVNDYVDNGNGTITDKATGLMWDQAGSNSGMNWKEALAWAEQKNAENYLGYSDWRLPDAKELQSIIDYERSPSNTNSAAIDPLFNVPTITDEAGNQNYPFYWTSTTHYDGPQPNKAVYICFGEALGYMNGRWIDVHGAGAQRSDPKDGDPADYPTGHGPQGDCIRIYNYVRLVRTPSQTTPVELHGFKANQNEIGVVLSWSTASETNNYGFNIEKSTNGNTFQLIAFVDGNGTSNKTNEYEYVDEDIAYGPIWYRLQQVDSDGSVAYSADININIEQPQEFVLQQNYPNPFNPTTTIRYTIPANGKVSLIVYDRLGELVNSLVNSNQSAGSYSIDWEGTNSKGQHVSTGIYFYELVCGSNRLVKSMTFVK